LHLQCFFSTQNQGTNKFTHTYTFLHHSYFSYLHSHFPIFFALNSRFHSISDGAEVPQERRSSNSNRFSEISVSSDSDKSLVSSSFLINAGDSSDESEENFKSTPVSFFSATHRYRQMKFKVDFLFFKSFSGFWYFSMDLFQQAIRLNDFTKFVVILRF
jgi:hypothetical protein